MRLLRRIKDSLTPKGTRVRTIPLGLYQGIKMEISLKYSTQLYLGLFEAETHCWIRRLCKGINTAIDVGASVGEQTLYLLLKTNAKKVYAIEPVLEMCGTIRRNARFNGIAEDARFEIINKYAGEKNEKNTCSLDHLCAQIQQPCFIKIDVEYYEADVLRGSEQLLKRPGVRWLVETHSHDLEEKCKQIFLSHGYTVIIIFNAWWRVFIPEVRPAEQNRWMVAYK